MIQAVDSSIEVIHNNIVQVNDDENGIPDLAFSTSNDNKDADNESKLPLSGNGNNLDIDATSTNPSIDPGNDPTVNSSNKPFINPTIDVGDPSSDPGYNQRHNHSFTMSCNQFYVSLGEKLIVPIPNYLALWGNTPLDVSALDFDLLYDKIPTLSGGWN